MIKTKPLYINLLFTIIAAGLHAYLANKFFALQAAQSEGNSFCNLGGVWNCDAVSTSSYAKLLGHPLAVWGLSANLVFLLAQIVIALRQNMEDEWADATAYLSVVIAGASIVMGLISLTQLSSLCLFCVAAYALSFLNLLLLHLSGLNYLKSIKNFKNALTSKVSWSLALAVPILALMISSSLGGAQNSSEMKGLVEDRVRAWQAAAPSKFDQEIGLRLGASPENAKMTIVEFADFRCPHCKHAAPSIKAFVKSRNDVALIFKTYPLDGTCNNDSAFAGRGDGISCRLAFSVMCAEKLEKKGWQLFDSIFENQHVYSNFSSTEETDQELCKSGIDNCDQFKACMSDEATKVMIQKMAQEGTQAGLKGTPTFYINDRLLNGAQLLPVLDKVYDVIKSQ